MTTPDTPQVDTADDTELLDWYAENHQCMNFVINSWYAQAGYMMPHKKVGSDFRQAIRQARDLRNQWLERTARAHAKAGRTK